MTDGTEQKSPRVCNRCGSRGHLYSWQCIFDLHGKGDSFKTSCAYCETEIPSGGDRVADKYRNIYCGIECCSKGKDILIFRLRDRDERVPATEVAV